MSIAACSPCLPSGRCCVHFRQNLPTVGKALLISSVVCALLTAVAWQLGFTSSSLATSLFIGEGVLFMGGLLSLALSCSKKVHQISMKAQPDKPARESGSVSRAKKPSKTKQQELFLQVLEEPAPLPKKEPQRKLNSKPKASVEQKLVPPVASSKLTQKELEVSLDSWISDTSGLKKKEKAEVSSARVKAKTEILKCYQVRSEELSLSELNIQSLPSAIFQFTWLKKLFLNKSEVREIGEEIGNLTELTGLYMLINQIIKLPKSLGKLSNLRTLDLSSNALNHVPEQIFECQQLTWLSLSGNQITKLPEAVSKLTQLSILDVSDTGLSRLPPGLLDCKKLSSLLLSGSSIKQFGIDLASFPELRGLYLSRMELKVLPKGLDKCKNLAHLDLSENPIEQLGINLSCFPELNGLGLEHTNLTSLPTGLLDCKKLTVLSLPPRLSKNESKLRSQLPILRTIEWF